MSCRPNKICSYSMDRKQLFRHDFQMWMSLDVRLLTEPLQILICLEDFLSCEWILCLWVLYVHRGSHAFVFFCVYNSLNQLLQCNWIHRNIPLERCWKGSITWGFITDIWKLPSMFLGLFCFLFLFVKEWWWWLPSLTELKKYV